MKSTVVSILSLGLIFFAVQGRADLIQKTVIGIPYPFVTGNVEIPENYSGAVDKDVILFSGTSYFDEIAGKIESTINRLEQDAYDRYAQGRGDPKLAYLTKSQLFRAHSVLTTELTNFKARYTPLFVEQDYNRKIAEEILQGRGFLFSYNYEDKDTPLQQSEKQYCDNMKRLSHNKMLADISSRLRFSNSGGVFGAGTCWWHSSFVRAAAYLAIYKPDLPSPSVEKAKEIIKAIMNMERAVEIPGSKNLLAFSSLFEKQILEVLESAQWSEIASFQTRGFSGSSSDSPRDMQEQIEKAYSDFSQYRAPVYMMLQVSGITAHAWIVIDMKKTKRGYDLYVQDSAYHGTLVWRYIYGMPHFIRPDGKTFIPYVNEKERNDWLKLRAVGDKFCRAKK